MVALVVHLVASEWLPMAAALRRLDLVKPTTSDGQLAAALEEEFTPRAAKGVARPLRRHPAPPGTRRFAPSVTPS
eukprot:9227601-Pyramimonas_sp.AAC.1